jgi:diguanylate cyclase (GGDEF)-like protein/PAS domain S-box-containing protein
MAAGEIPEAPRARVLVVDDQPAAVAEVQRALADEFEIVYAADAQRGLELALSEADLAVVVASQFMLTASGHSLLEKLRETSAITRVLLSDCREAELLVRAVNRAGVFAIARKPFEPEALRQTLRAAVAEHAQHRERQFLEQLMQTIPEALYFKDRELRYVRANAACAALLGIDSPRSLEGKRDADLARDDAMLDLEASQRLALERGEALADQISRYQRHGEQLWLSSSHAPVNDASGEIAGVVGIARDVTAHMRREDELTRQIDDLALIAHYDELTHLPKRGLLMDRLQQRLAAAASGGGHIALVLIDIDRFRRINVSLGRDAGDMLIFAIVGRLRPLLGSDDTLARLDGNTFAWLLADASEPSLVVARLERDVLPRLRAPYRLEEAELRVSCRIGVAVGPNDGESAELLIRHAEAALNKAAVTNQPYVFYAPVMNERIAERLALENRLRRAIENDEFLLHYQPKLELKTGQIVGLEALIHNKAWCRRLTSYPSSKKPALSSRSGVGCFAKRRSSSCAGAIKAAIHPRSQSTCRHSSSVKAISCPRSSKRATTTRAHPRASSSKSPRAC